MGPYGNPGPVARHGNRVRNRLGVPSPPQGYPAVPPRQPMPGAGAMPHYATPGQMGGGNVVQGSDFGRTRVPLHPVTPGVPPGAPSPQTIADPPSAFGIGPAQGGGLDQQQQALIAAFLLGGARRRNQP